MLAADAFACFAKVSTELLSLCDPTEDGYVEFSEIVRALRLKAIGGKDQAEYMKKMSKISLQVTTTRTAMRMLCCLARSAADAFLLAVLCFAGDQEGRLAYRAE